MSNRWSIFPAAWWAKWWPFSAGQELPDPGAEIESEFDGRSDLSTIFSSETEIIESYENVSVCQVIFDVQAVESAVFDVETMAEAVFETE
jgi:hypothetical protein